MAKCDFPRLKKEQERLARRVRLRDGLELSEIRTVAGADLTFLNPWKTPTEGIACIIRMSFPAMEVLERVVTRARVTFPYVPGFLAYRELPLLMKTYRKMGEKADVFLIDGQGIAHPRRFGIAAHFGVATGEMTIGCAKSWLYGEFREPPHPGDDAPLFAPRAAKAAPTRTSAQDGQVPRNVALPGWQGNDRGRGRLADPSWPRLSRDRQGLIGRVLRPGKGKSLLFISPGHRVSVGSSLKIVKLCLKGHKIPEPTRLAHNHLQEVRRGLLKVVSEDSTSPHPSLQRRGNSSPL